tara:strand:- start:2116 stop:2391 length:276 start_codon:yes stop_codon:yes gene_type:complete
MTKIIILIIKFYQFFISPLLGNRCRYLPSCSDYFIESLEKHGFSSGLLLGFKRILKCHPIKKLGGGDGVDFVPIPKKTSWKLKNNKEIKNG